MEPLYKTNMLGIKLEVYPSYIKYTQLFITKTFAINQITSIEPGIPGIQQVKIETSDGKKHKLVVRMGDKTAFVNAAYEAMRKNK